MNEKIIPLLAACREHEGGDPSEQLRAASGEFLGLAQSDTSIVVEGANSLIDLPPAGSAWMAVLLGAVVEHGGDPALTGPPLFEFYHAQLEKIPSIDPSVSDEVELSPAQADVLESLPELSRSVVAHLARLPDHRLRLSTDQALIGKLDEVENISYGACWVREALRRHSGPLMVFHPPSGQGFRLHYHNVGYCFHLFSLLQIALADKIPDTPQPNPEVIEALDGDSELDVSDEAWWHYGSPRSNKPDLVEMIWGEGPVVDIPLVDEVPVILLWPSTLESRSWNSGFFGPHLQALPARVEIIDTLEKDECQQWFQKLNLDWPQDN